VESEKCFPRIIHCGISHLVYRVCESTVRSRPGLKEAYSSLNLTISGCFVYKAGRVRCECSEEPAGTGSVRLYSGARSASHFTLVIYNSTAT
jgi:hypothetical protein